MKKIKNFFSYYVNIFTIIGTILLIISIVWGYKYFTKQKLYDKTIQATIIEVDSYSDSDGTYYKPTFTYTYKNIEYTDTYDYSSTKYKKGQIINIKINSDNPNKVDKRNLGFIGLLIMGIVFLVKGIFDY